MMTLIAILFLVCLLFYVGIILFWEDIPGAEHARAWIVYAGWFTGAILALSYLIEVSVKATF